MESVIVSNFTELLLVAVYVRVFDEKTNQREGAKFELPVVAARERWVAAAGERKCSSWDSPGADHILKYKKIVIFISYC